MNSEGRGDRAGMGRLLGRSTGAPGIRAWAQMTFLALAAFGLSASTLSAQEEKVEVRFTRVYLTNGNVVDGQLVGRTRTGVTLRFSGGDLTIPDGQVSRVETIVFSDRREVAKPPPPSTEKAQRVSIPEPPGNPTEASASVQSRVDDLLRTLGMVGQEQKHVIAKSLSGLGKEATPYLLGRFESLDVESRGFVFELLLEQKDPSTLAAVRKLLGSKQATVRVQAAQLLASLGDSSQADSLRGLLEDKDSRVRGAATDALAALGDRGSFDAIAALCKDSNAATRRKAIAACVRLAKKFEMQDRWAHDLKELLDETRGEMRSDLVCALGQTGSRDAARGVILFLGDESSEVRAAVVGALADLGAKEEADALVRQMDSEKDKWVRLRMATTAQRLRLVQAVPDLIEWLDDPDSEIKAASLAGLGEITSQNFGQDKAKWAAWWARLKPK